MAMADLAIKGPYWTLNLRGASTIIQVLLANLPTLLPWFLDLSRTVLISGFEHSNSQKSTLSKSLYWRGVLVSVKKKRKGNIAAVITYSQLSSLPLKRHLLILLLFPTEREYLLVIAPSNIIDRSRWSYPPLPWVPFAFDASEQELSNLIALLPPIPSITSMASVPWQLGAQTRGVPKESRLWPRRCLPSRERCGWRCCSKECCGSSWVSKRS